MAALTNRPKRPDEPILPTKSSHKQGIIPKLLTWLGKPFYFLLAFLLISFLAISYYTGRIILKSILFLIRLGWSFQKILTLTKLKIPPSFISARQPKFQIRPIIAIFFFLILFTAGSVYFWNWIIKDLPRPQELTTRQRPLTTKIYDRHGNLLYKIYRNENRTVVPLSQIPLSVRQATVAIEDSEFYYHPGFSVRGIISAIKRNITNDGEISGGSTITQQLVKNVLLSPQKTLQRKLKEILLSIFVEMTYSKDQILEMYLNEVSYGGATRGIEEASQLYFNKHARDLSLGEAALLAGLTRAPTKYSPFGTNPKAAKERQKQVLQRMVEEGYISQKQADETWSEKIDFAPQKTDIYAPHFVMYVKQILVEKYGEQMVEQGGLEVTTSLDLEIQKEAEKIVHDEVNRLAPLRIGNGAALVTNPKTGEILAMVGSKDYFDSKNDGNYNVTTALRQPGSSIKPVNYSYALANGYTAASIISDTPVTYSVAGSPPYSPKNYDNRYHGNVSLRTALASSYNIPAVKVLASYGVNKMIEQGKKLGITTWDDPSRFGLSLTLGGGEVRMLDMALVYGTLANYGRRVELLPILKVKDSFGNILQEYKCGENQFGQANTQNGSENLECQGTQVLDPRIAFILTDILSDNQARTPAFGSNSLLAIPQHKEVAVKTGTSQDLRDNWAIGYNQDFVVVTWVGNNDNSPMAWVASGITGATPIWNKIMSFLLQDKPNHPWEPPAGLVKRQICTQTGTLPCEGCLTKEEWFIKGTEPKFACLKDNLIQKNSNEKILSTSNEH